jgi:large subunit ribosomal protein L7Ae
MSKVVKKPAAAPAKTVAKSAPKKGKDWKADHAHLFEKKAKNFKIGADLPVKRDLSRYVKWPAYIRVQRQRAILKKRLKVPPAINQFTRTLDKNQATTLFRLLSGYRPESRDEKKKRLYAKAQAEVKSTDVKTGAKPLFIKYGLNHVTDLIEAKKAKLVVIAHDVDPIELVVWLPALCRKMNVPYCIVKGKARLGHLVHKKTATVVAVTDLKKEDSAKLDQFVANIRGSYNDDVSHRRKWGGGTVGIKATHVIRKREKIAAREAAGKGQ